MGNTLTDSVERTNYIAILDRDFVAESKEDLFNHARSLCVRMQNAIIVTYWLIGKSIINYYKKDYGTGIFEELVEATGISADTLQKSSKFARTYSEKQLQVMLSGDFIPSWRHIANNLAIRPEKLIEVYKASKSKKQFYHGVIKLKDPTENRGRLKKKGKQSANQEEPDSKLFKPDAAKPVKDQPDNPESIEDTLVKDEETSKEIEVKKDVSGAIEEQAVKPNNENQNSISQKDKRILELEAKVKRLKAEIARLLSIIHGCEKH